MHDTHGDSNNVFACIVDNEARAFMIREQVLYIIKCNCSVCIVWISTHYLILLKLEADHINDVVKYSNHACSHALMLLNLEAECAKRIGEW